MMRARRAAWRDGPTEPHAAPPSRAAASRITPPAAIRAALRRTDGLPLANLAGRAAAHRSTHKTVGAVPRTCVSCHTPEAPGVAWRPEHPNWHTPHTGQAGLPHTGAWVLGRAMLGTLHLFVRRRGKEDPLPLTEHRAIPRFRDRHWDSPPSASRNVVRAPNWPAPTTLRRGAPW